MSIFGCLTWENMGSHAAEKHLPIMPCMQIFLPLSVTVHINIWMANTAWQSTTQAHFNKSQKRNRRNRLRSNNTTCGQCTWYCMSCNGCQRWITWSRVGMQECQSLIPFIPAWPNTQNAALVWESLWGKELVSPHACDTSRPSYIPLIGFWIHKMPPIRWGDWPSIPSHWLSRRSAADAHFSHL